MSSSPAQGPGATELSASSGPCPPSVKLRKCRPGYKSAAKLARSRERARCFHLSRSLKQENASLGDEIEKIKAEKNLIEEEYYKFKDECSQKVDEALSSQKTWLNEKHLKILKYYSDTLTKRYEQQFNDSSSYFQAKISERNEEIEMLKHDLEVSRQARIAFGLKKPVYSPGRYRDDG